MHPWDLVGNSNMKRVIPLFLRKVAVVLLLACFSLGAGFADASVLCIGRDGHQALEFSGSCAFCSVRSGHPGQRESIALAGKLPAGDACGPCRDYSISSMDVFSGVSAPHPSISGRDHVALPLSVSVEGPWLMVPSASTVFGPWGPPDLAANQIRTVVLLI